MEITTVISGDLKLSFTSEIVEGIFSPMKLNTNISETEIKTFRRL